MQFFEKPGCVNGEKQKKILTAAGHRLECINILDHSWTREELLPFIQGKQPVAIMNYTAPVIKRGELRPDQLTFEEAVSRMLDDPLLIKRPLIRVDGLSIQGFADEQLAPYLGDWDGREDVVTCPHLQSLSCDERKESA